jgi:outer membrane receptor protein involved in Fe transport
MAKATTTDSAGSFSMDNIRPGSYILRISSIGYQSWNSPPFNLMSGHKDWGVRVLAEDSRQLGEVVVRAERSPFQQRPDGTVVNVGNSIMTKGSTALEVLERSPGVVIDHRNNSIDLNGKSGVTVTINGKATHMSVEQVVALLNGMSADDIEKIELLTTPTARYDADGSAGVINIVLKKNKKLGTNGTLALTGGYGKGEKGTGSISLSHNTAKANLYGSYTFSHNKTYSDMFIISDQNMPILGGQLEVLVWDTTRRNQNNHDANIGLDFKLNPTTTIGGSLIYNNNVGASTSLSHNRYTVFPDSLLLFDGRIVGTNHWNNLISSVYLEKYVRDGEKINFDLDYLSFTNHNSSDVLSSFRNKEGIQAGTDDSLFSPRQRTFANTSIQVGVAKMDYTKQLSSKIKLETGVKGAYTKSISVSGIESLVNGSWGLRSEASNDIIMKEGIGAAYASVNTQLSPSINLVAGVRYEYSLTKMDDQKTGLNIVDRKLGALFPSVFLSKKINELTDWSLSYTKRISRPSYNDLASYVGYSDPTAVYTGNPFLSPTITHNVKLGYTYRGYSFSLLYSRDINPIARYQITESPSGDLLYVSPQNLQWQNNLNFQTILPWKVNSWWTMNYSFVGGLRQFKENYTMSPVEKTWFGYSLNVNQTFKLPKSWSAELSGWYSSRFYNSTIKVAGMGVLNAGIKKELKNNGGTFQLSVSDIFRGEHYNVFYGTLTREAFNIKNHVTVNTESSKIPILKLTYSRSFGSTLLKSQRSGSEDERDRIRKD